MRFEPVEKKPYSRLIKLRLPVVVLLFISTGIGLAVHSGWGTLSSMGISQIVYLCPLGALEVTLASKLFIPRVLLVLGVVALLVALFGKFFCSWACPVPFLLQFFHPSKKVLSDNVAVKSVETGVSSSEMVGDALLPIGGQRDRSRFDTRHGVLLGALLSSALFGFPVFCLVCPIGLSFATLVVIWRVFTAQEMAWSLLVFPLILALELILFRKWCHRLCPMGALLFLLAQRAPFFKPHVNSGSCLRTQGLDCHICVEACPEQLDPHTDRLPECTRCALCAHACPSRSISLGKNPHVE
jgi:ferredoxin-type protein NapH